MAATEQSFGIRFFKRPRWATVGIRAIQKHKKNGSLIYIRLAEHEFFVKWRTC